LQKLTKQEPHISGALKSLSKSAILVITFLSIFSLVDSMFSAFWTELADFFYDLIISSFVIRRNVISFLTFSAEPSAILTFTFCHKISVTLKA